MLTEPLTTLGVEIDQENPLLESILAITSGHPNLIQYVGKALIEAANARQERLILLADWQVLQEHGDFTAYFLSTIWGAGRSPGKNHHPLRPGRWLYGGNDRT